MGIGLIIGVMIMSFYPATPNESIDIENEARNMGMIYPSEAKISEMLEVETDD